MLIHFTKRTLSLCLITLCCSLSAFASAEEPISFQIAVSPNLNLETLKTSELSKVFSGRRANWSNSTPVQLILFPAGSPEMKWLCKQLKVPEHLLRRFIFQRVYRAQLRKPLEVTSVEDAVQLLSTTPGAIAPIRVDDRLRALLSADSSSQELNLIQIQP